MANYDLFAGHYDVLLPDPINKAKRIENYIKTYHPKAKTILELACGTGSVLKNVSGKFDKSGLDQSEQMLSIARKKVKEATFYNGNMASFKLNRKFDVVICIFDAINHLLKFSEWEELYHTSYDHLTEGGLFIFDVNTLYRLKKLASQPTTITRFGQNNIFLLSVTKTRNGYYNWVPEVFEHQKGSEFSYYKEIIPEVGFPVKRIRKALREKFYAVITEDDNTKRLSRYSERVWFICQKHEMR